MPKSFATHRTGLRRASGGMVELRELLERLNQLINSPARAQSEWMLGQILQERASVVRAASEFHK